MAHDQQAQQRGRELALLVEYELAVPFYSRTLRGCAAVYPLDDVENLLGDEEESCADDSSYREDEAKTERRKGENTLYWKAITQLLFNETEEVRRTV